MTKIIWSILAAKALKEIYLYYKIVAGEKKAIKIKSGIFSVTKQLPNQPELGQIETKVPTLRTIFIAFPLKENQIWALGLYCSKASE